MHGPGVAGKLSPNERRDHGAATLGTLVKKLGYAAVLATAAICGCSHPVEIKNLRDYRSTELNPLADQVAVGIVPSPGDKQSEQLIRSIAVGLKKHTNMVVMPYVPATTRSTDVVAHISVQPDYRGSWANFFINFPGFLVWAPAWNGYVYKIDYTIDIVLSRESDNEKIDSWTMPINLNIRQSDISRTWAAEISWFEVGVFALVSGAIYTGYDEDVTPLVLDKIDTPIGDFVAQEIVNRLNNSGTVAVRRVVAPSAPYAPAPPVEAPVTAAPAPAAVPPPAAAPVATVAAPVPAAAAPIAIRAAGQSARLKAGGALRTRPTRAGDTKNIDPATVFELRSSMRNADGLWWYAAAGAASGWVLDQDLQAP